jgi:hypothetical protein
VICTVSPGQIDSLVHPRRDADASAEALRVDRLVVIAARHDQRDDQSRVLVRPKEGEVFRSPHLDRDRAKWVHDRRPQRHLRQLAAGSLGFEDVVPCAALWPFEALLGGI